MLKTPDEICENIDFDDQDEVILYQSCNMRNWVRYEMSNETADWGFKPQIFMQRNSKYVLVYNQQTMQVLNCFPIEKSKENRYLCKTGGSLISSFAQNPSQPVLDRLIRIFILEYSYHFNLVIHIATFRMSIFAMLLHCLQLLFH